ncbi:uncharacterized protein LOC115631934 isoform X2 [Scaptodrosophila lebanonensis]|nr:uncharacterized protein LOC115631934 isoform X2 [Scaptodrosophila lebanonensis]
MIYVGRAEQDGDMHVCKVVPSKQIGFISTRGEALPKDIFEVLCGQNLAWVKCYDHVIPETAVLCGRTTLDQPVYIGRGHYEGHLIVGKISSVHRALFIAYRGAERRLDSYEILVEERRVVPGWQLPPPEEAEKCPLTPPPPPSPPAPVSEKPYRFPYPINVAMPFPNQEPPPMYTPTAAPTYPPEPVIPQPIVVAAASPLMSTDPLPPPPLRQVYTPAETGGYVPASSYIPASSTFTPADSYKPPLDPYGPGCSSYVPAECVPTTTQYAVSVAPPADGYDMWVTASPGYTPADAVVAGHDADMSQLLVCRAYYDGFHVPGKAVPSRGCAYISHAGREIVQTHYEVLIGQSKYRWVSGYDGSIPLGAVEAGRNANGEILYIGRALYCGTLTPGKVHPSHKCLYIPFGGTEHRIINYEVLVRKNFYQQQAIYLTY